MKTLFTAQVTSKGARSGTLHSDDGLLDIALGNPLQDDIKSRGPNPETLFAGAYSACFHGAVVNAAERLMIPITDSTVSAEVSLIEEDNGGYRLQVNLHMLLPDVAADDARKIMEEAHVTCPYSKALRGDVEVLLTVD